MHVITTNPVLHSHTFYKLTRIFPFFLTSASTAGHIKCQFSAMCTTQRDMENYLKRALSTYKQLVLTPVSQETGKHNYKRLQV